MTSVSSSLTTSSLYSTRVSSLDTNGDGVISAEERAAGETGSQRTQDPTVTSDSAAGGIASQLADGLIAMLLSAGDTGAGSDQRKSGADMFASMDTDGDGKVSQAEFVAARPGDVSEEDATALFSSIDTEGTGSVTEDQFVTAMEANRPDGPPPPPPIDESAVSADESETISLLDVLEEMQQVIAAYAANAEGEASSETSTTQLTL